MSSGFCSSNRLPLRGIASGGNLKRPRVRHPESYSAEAEFNGSDAHTLWDIYLTSLSDDVPSSVRWERIELNFPEMEEITVVNDNLLHTPLGFDWRIGFLSIPQVLLSDTD